MLRQEQISHIIDSQRVIFEKKDDELPREILQEVPIIDNFATIITGVRRCGKSTLLLQILKDKYEQAINFNFEDIRLAGFETADFTRLHKEIIVRQTRILFFDEIQIIPKWEIYVNQLLREGFTVFITGSNASMLSVELGTHLTGRHISMELFPFTFREFTSFKNVNPNKESLGSYLQSGGFPEFLKSGSELIHTSLMEDILIRDISVRHSIRDVDSLTELAIYLISNTGNLVSANRLTGMFGIKSSATILEYFSFFKDAYLIEFLPQFSYSLKAQARNPKKIYAIDTGLISSVSMGFSENKGHLLETMVYWHLRRSYKKLYFFKDKGECDFIVFDRNKVITVVQVCAQVTDLNFEQELNGLLEALKYFELTTGVIVTTDQKDFVEVDGFKVKLIPAYEFLLESGKSGPE